MNHVVISTLSLLWLPSLSFADDAPQTGTGQLGAVISQIEVPNAPGEFYLGQATADGRLILTPNESFFPKLGLTAAGMGSVEDINQLNGGKSFASIKKWDVEDTAEWGIFTQSAGTVTVSIWMSTQNTKGHFQLQIGDLKQDFRTIRPGNHPLVAAQLNFRIPSAGMHSVKLTCIKPGADTQFHWMTLAGQPAEKAAVLRKRWRPAAAHTKFTSSRSNAKTRLWVMEMDAVPGELGFYCPMATPFGYYGPTWQADGTVNAGFNFSLWSYPRGAAEPPVEQLSHLLAIGNRTAQFGGFGHEGTGVKIRGWEPLKGIQGQRQAIALRVEAGTIYDTYFSYFYDTQSKLWKLFGAGNKFNKGKPISNLWVGSFVEVPGPPPVQRTGPYKRTMRYRGWVMDVEGNWSQLDQMKLGNVDKQTGLTHTNRGVTKDDWFFLQTGGWSFRKGSTQQTVARESSAKSTLPEFLSDSDISTLTSIPSTIRAKLNSRSPNRIAGTFHVDNLDEDATVTMFWGSAEGLTFADRWQNQKVIPTVAEGSQPFQIDELPDDQTVYVRFLLQNKAGQFWSKNTLIVKP